MPTFAALPWSILLDPADTAMPSDVKLKFMQQVCPILQETRSKCRLESYPSSFSLHCRDEPVELTAACPLNHLRRALDAMLLLLLLFVTGCQWRVCEP
jgi:hypothetical protein